MGSIMMVLSWMGFTLPPECTAYWVGEVGQPTSEDRDRRLRNMATMHMAKGLRISSTMPGSCKPIRRGTLIASVTATRTS